MQDHTQHTVAMATETRTPLSVARFRGVDVVAVAPEVVLRGAMASCGSGGSFVDVSWRLPTSDTTPPLPTTHRAAPTTHLHDHTCACASCLSGNGCSGDGWALVQRVFLRDAAGDHTTRRPPGGRHCTVTALAWCTDGADGAGHTSLCGLLAVGCCVSRQPEDAASSADGGGTPPPTARSTATTTTTTTMMQDAYVAAGVVTATPVPRSRGRRGVLSPSGAGVHGDGSSPAGAGVELAHRKARPASSAMRQAAVIVLAPHGSGGVRWLPVARLVDDLWSGPVWCLSWAATAVGIHNDGTETDTSFPLTLVAAGQCLSVWGVPCAPQPLLRPESWEPPLHTVASSWCHRRDATAASRRSPRPFTACDIAEDRRHIAATDGYTVEVRETSIRVCVCVYVRVCVCGYVYRCLHSDLQCVCVCVCAHYFQVWHVQKGSTTEPRLAPPSLVKTTLQTTTTTPDTHRHAPFAPAVSASVAWRPQPVSEQATSVEGDCVPSNSLLVLDAAGNITLWRESDPHERHMFIKCAALRSGSSTPRRSTVLSTPSLRHGTTAPPPPPPPPLPTRLIDPSCRGSTTPAPSTPHGAPSATSPAFVSVGWVGFVPTSAGAHWGWLPPGAPVVHAFPLRGSGTMLRPPLSALLHDVGHDEWAPTAVLPNGSSCSRDWVVGLGSDRRVHVWMVEAVASSPRQSVAVRCCCCRCCGGGGGGGGGTQQHRAREHLTRDWFC